MKSTHRRSDFTRRRRISHREAIFHPPVRVDFVEKRTAKAVRFSWQGHKGSNPGHAVLETAALPTELYPYMKLDLRLGAGDGNRLPVGRAVTRSDCHRQSFTPRPSIPAKRISDFCFPSKHGAGDGNRTRTASLEGWNSTIELHPQNQRLIIIAQPCAPVKFFLKFCVRKRLGGFLRCALLPRRAEREFSQILYFLLTRRFCVTIMKTDVL